jgi:hypothetical protein
MPRTILTVAMVVALAATEARAARPLPASGELACGSPHRGECDYYDPATNLLVVWQRDWPVRRLKLVTETGPSAEARQQDATRWIALVYQPDDDAQPEAPLFQVAVLPRSDWIRQSMKSSLVAGVEVASDRQLVAIASVQGANPYPPDSRDADIFDALLPRIEEISRLVQFAEATSLPSPSRRGGRGVSNGAPSRRE